MRGSIEPALQRVAIHSLRPTQMTVGMAEVERKRAQWREFSEADGANFLGARLVPVVEGPKQRLWLIDQHHLALALHREGVEQVLVSVVARLGGLDKQSFLTFMDKRNWLHPYDVSGKRRRFDALPKTLDQLTDDPFRSLAGALREAGGYAKSEVPFAEFLWADFLRTQFDAKKLRKIGARELERARDVARSKAARHLPGWCGPD